MSFERNVPSVTFELERTIQPIYTGGDVVLDNTGRFLVSCLSEDVVITDLNTGESLARIDGVRSPVGRTQLEYMLKHNIGWRIYHCAF